MMQQHLRTPQHWRRWLEALESVPGREAELDARASMIIERRLTGEPAEDPVLDAIEAALAFERRLSVAPVAAPPAPARRLPWRRALLLAAAAGLLLGLLLPLDLGAPEPPVSLRGAAPAPAGLVQLHEGGDLLGQYELGTGLRPRVALGDGPLALSWIPSGPGWHAIAWRVDGGDPVALDGAPGFTRLGEGAAAVDAPGPLVVAVAPDTVALDPLPRLVGDGRRAVPLPQGVTLLAVDLEDR